MAAPKHVVAEPPPYNPALYELADASAVQAMARGEASAEQQQRVLNWIINAVAGTYDMDYRHDARDHAFTSGRRFVGLQIIKILKINVGALSKREQDRQNPTFKQE